MPAGRTLSDLARIHQEDARLRIHSDHDVSAEYGESCDGPLEADRADQPWSGRLPEDELLRGGYSKRASVGGQEIAGGALGRPARIRGQKSAGVHEQPSVPGPDGAARRMDIAETLRRPSHCQREEERRKHGIPPSQMDHRLASRCKSAENEPS